MFSSQSTLQITQTYPILTLTRLFTFAYSSWYNTITSYLCLAILFSSDTCFLSGGTVDIHTTNKDIHKLRTWHWRNFAGSYILHLVKTHWRFNNVAHYLIKTRKRVLSIRKNWNVSSRMWISSDSFLMPKVIPFYT